MPIYVLIYGIKDEAKNDLKLDIYDFEKYYEISSLEYFKVHMPIDMNYQPIINLGEPAGFKDAVSNTSLSSIIKDSYIFGTVTRSTFSRGGRSYLYSAYTFQC